MFRRWICALLAALMLLTTAWAEPPAWSPKWEEVVELKGEAPRYLARRSGKWSLLDGDGSILQDGWLDGFDGFFEGVAAIRMRGKWGFMLEDGEMLVEPRFDYAGAFSDGVARVEVDDLRGYIDRSGQYLIEPRYYRANDFQGDYAAVARKGAYSSEGSSAEDYEALWGVIDRAGETVLPMEYDAIEIDREDSVAIAELNGETHYFHLRGSSAEEVAQLGSDFSLEDYYPNEGSRVAALDGPANLSWDAGAQLPRLDGATALFPVYSAIVQAVYPRDARYGGEEDAPLVTCTKTNRAYERLIEGSADVIFCAGPSDAQLAAARAAGVELELTPFGAEAFVFFVNRENPLEDIATRQIQGVYGGTITDWCELGVEGLGEIVAYQRPKNSGSQTALEELMGDVPLMAPMQKMVMCVMDEIIETVEYRNLPNAIGYSFRFFCEEMVGSAVKLLRIDGVAPTVENIRSGTYPHVTALYAVTRRGETNPNVQILLDWLTSQQGQALVEASGYVAAAQ